MSEDSPSYAQLPKLTYQLFIYCIQLTHLQLNSNQYCFFNEKPTNFIVHFCFHCFNYCIAVATVFSIFIRLNFQEPGFQETELLLFMLVRNVCQCMYANQFYKRSQLHNIIIYVYCWLVALIVAFPQQTSWSTCYLLLKLAN